MNRSLGRLFGWILAGCFLLPAGTALAEAYGFDKDHTRVLFKWNHLGMSNQFGTFNKIDGDVEFSPDKWDKTRIAVTIDANSVDTDVAKLDEHLRSEDFFNTAKFPKITFKSTEVRQTSAKGIQIVGDLTIKGKTKSVILDTTFHYLGEHPLAKVIKAYEGAMYAGFSAMGRVRRSDFDLGLYAPFTSDTIDLVIETELRQKK